MMKSLFRAFEIHHVRYLLISGQACVLYGASQFTEDVDLWIEPTPGNVRSLLRALASVKARVYKLTPPLEMPYVRSGHGFHFRIGRDVYLDVMGRPPRVGGFTKAAARSRRMKTAWGILPVVAPEDLILLKRTNRPGDYEAISNLVRMRVQEDDRQAVLRWALVNTFDVTDLAEFALMGASRLIRWPSRPAVRSFLPLSSKRPRISERRLSKARRLLALEMADLQETGRRYWRPVLSELRRLQAQKKLIPEGTPMDLLV